MDTTRLSPLIAIVGCDGSGKSTVIAAVVAWASRLAPTQAVHLGKQSGNVARALGRLPWLGAFIDRRIAHKTDKTRAERNIKVPGFFTALVICLFSLRRAYRYKCMMTLRRRGIVVVSDRYPQLDVAGAYDGPGLSVDAPGNVVVRWMARRERALFEWMTHYRPDLVIRLNVDLDVACARKPDHRRELLAAKVAATQQLKFNGAPIVDINANQPLPDVLAAAQTAAAAALAALGYRELDPLAS
ncbi:MAG: ATP-binding protein [Lysobacterales bacterium CG17_big_fil_post_rev_8_21_14_2_50_64_11]|nr:MAG: ATP-binding protein [Xanthomonadales bacterium CG17_big_fil_post_rev_8_21_14_2_50_64_11]